MARTVTRRRSQHAEVEALPPELREPVLAYAKALRAADDARRAMMSASSGCSLRYFDLCAVVHRLKY